MDARTALIEVDVCVVGGGPAGAVAAIQLSRMGHRVCLVSDDRPRARIVESLPSSVLPLLDFVGGGKDIAPAIFSETSGEFLSWGRHAVDFDFVKTAGRTIHIQRTLFDGVLLNAARAAGVIVLGSSRAARPTGPEQIWHIKTAGSHHETEIRARFIVDAAGKRGIVPSERRWCSERTVCMHAAARSPAALRLGAPIVVAGTDHWIWCSPSPRGVEINVFMDASRCKGASPKSRGDLFAHVVSRSQLARFLPDIVVDMPVTVCCASSHYSTDPVRPGVLRVGEASCAIDPLSSQGIHAAILSAVHGSVVANTMLRRPAAAAGAMDFYRARQADTIRSHQRWAAEHYEQMAVHARTSFWERRAARTATSRSSPSVPVDRSLAPDTRVSVSPLMSVQKLPVLAGEYIDLMTVVVHPALESPMAYVGGYSVHDVVESVRHGESARALTERLSHRMPSVIATGIVRSLWNNSILIPADRSAVSDAQEGL